MPTMDKRSFLKVLALGAAGTATGGLPFLMQNATAAEAKPKDFYNIPKKGQARILHTTDLHGQLLPVYFREPNVNLGVGEAYGRPPHIVGKKLLEYMKLPLDGQKLTPTRI